MKPTQSNQIQPSTQHPRLMRVTTIGLLLLTVFLVVALMVKAGFSGFTENASVWVYGGLVAIPLIVIGVINTIRQSRTNPRAVLWTWLALGLAWLLTIWLANYETKDWRKYLSQWCLNYHNASWSDALKIITDTSDYTPLYNYYLIAISHLFSIPNCLYAIKFLTFAFSLALAVVMELMICEIRRTKFNYLHVACFLILPPILFEFTAWGQCDAIYTTFSLLAFYFALKHRSVPCFLSLGLAFAIKMQFLFIVPIIFVMLIIRDADGKKYLKWQWIWLAPLMYLLNLVPLCVGTSFKDLCMVYFRQVGTHQRISSNCVNLPMLFDWAQYTHNQILITALELGLAAVGIAATIWLLVLVFRAHRRQPLTRVDLVRYATCFALVMVYLMPKMHERFFFIAMALVVVWCFVEPSRFHALLAAMVTTALSISIGIYLLKLPDVITVILFVIALVINTLAIYWLVSPLVRADYAARHAQPTPPTTPSTTTATTSPTAQSTPTAPTAPTATVEFD